MTVGDPSKGFAATDPPSCNSTMKISGLVLMLSAFAMCNAEAGETILRNQHFAQMDQPNQANASGGSCMPIGLTARGELVFPWECRAIIERERGPVSVDISAPSQNPAKDPEPIAPAAREPAAKAAAVDNAAKDQPPPRSAEAEHVGSIPDPASSPTPGVATAEPSDRRSQGKQSPRRRQTDNKGARSPVSPSAAQPIRESRVPPRG